MIASKSSRLSAPVLLVGFDNLTANFVPPLRLISAVENFPSHLILVRYIAGSYSEIKRFLRK